MKHTPGPWRTAGLFIKAARRLTICEIEDNVKAHYDNTPKINANARLIAAAPELLEALNKLADCAESITPDRTRLLNTIEIARAVIAKATQD